MSSLILLFLAAPATFAQSNCYSPSDCFAPQYCSSLEDGVVPGTCLDPVEEESSSSSSVDSSTGGPGPIEFEITEGTEGQRQATSSGNDDSGNDKSYFMEKLNDYNEIAEGMGEYLDDLKDASLELSEEEAPTGNAFINFFTQTIPNFFTSAWCGIFGC